MATIGDASIDWGTLLLSRHGTTLKLTPKAAAVLQLLLIQPGVTLGRREILDTVWPATASGDEVLTTVINELRRAFGDSAKDARYIVTIPKLGYRWVGPPTGPEHDTAPVATSALKATPAAAGRSPIWRWLLLAVVLALGVAALMTLRMGVTPDTNASTAVATTTSIASTPISITATPITSEPGLDLEPDLDAQGRRVAYTHITGDHVALRVRDLNATAYTTIDLGNEGTPSSPAWSPDGAQIAYVWHGGERCELRVVAMTDERSRTLAADCPSAIATSLDWSPDGGFLVYSRYDEDDAALGSRNIAVFRVALDGSDLQRLSHSRRWLTVDGHPRISADGLSVAFVRDGDGHHRVIVVDATGTGAEREIATAFWPYRAEWYGDSTLLVAGHGTTPAEIWRVDMAGTGARRLGTDAVGPGLSVSRHGRVVVTEQRRLDDNLWSVDLTDPQSPPRQETHETRSERCPRIAPDGRTLAYLSDENGALEVTLRDLHSGVHRRISAFAPYSPLDLRWSPSSNYLAVVLGTDTGKHLAVLSANGERLAIPAAIAELSVAQAEWSSTDNELLLVVTTQGRRELHRIDFPQLEHSELVVDFSVGWVAGAAGQTDLLFTRPEGYALERFSADGAISTVDGVVLNPAPSDQWVVHDQWLAQMQQIERGTAATITLKMLGGTTDPRVLRIAAPEPPLGRTIDLGAGRLWYASRDVDEADLVTFDLEQH